MNGGKKVNTNEYKEQANICPAPCFRRVKNERLFEP